MNETHPKLEGNIIRIRFKKPITIYQEEKCPLCKLPITGQYYFNTDKENYCIMCKKEIQRKEYITTYIIQGKAITITYYSILLKLDKNYLIKHFKTPDVNTDSLYNYLFDNIDGVHIIEDSTN